MPRGYDKAVGYVAIKLDNGEFRPGGTAFLTSMPADDLEGCHHLYWVTAQHVINQAEFEGVDGRAHIVVPGVSGEPSVLTTAINAWFKHDEPHVDVAVHPHGLTVPDTDLRAISVADYLSSDAVQVGAEIFFAALPPMDLRSAAFRPAVRSGTVKSTSHTATTKLGQAKYLALDATSIGGHSGSPCSTQVVKGHALGFIGMVAGHANDGDKPAIAVPADRIKEVLNGPELKRRRREEEARLKRDGWVPDDDDGRRST